MRGSEQTLQWVTGPLFLHHERRSTRALVCDTVCTSGFGSATVHFILFHGELMALSSYGVQYGHGIEETVCT
jgi:hypothetical protein